jgi:iron complex outermembrane receptor protein
MTLKAGLRAGAAITLAAVVISAPAAAQDAQVSISIPAQNLEDALIQFSRQTRQQLMFSPAAVKGRTAKAISGQFTSSRALQQLLAGTGLEATATPSGAWIIKSADVKSPATSFTTQGAPASLEASEGASAAGGSPSEIIVTARRREESLQDVPQTVNAVTGEELAKLNLQRFEDLQSVVSGLDLSSGARGFDTAASIRGVSYAVRSQTSPTVEFYLNDAPMPPGVLFQSVFDIGQIEVLRGPQGTMRGRAAPSGAITITTRRPNVSEVGGYVDMTGTIRGNINAQAAINVPLVADVLAVRVAGLIDENESSGIESINNGTSPWQRTKALRASARLDPTDNLSATIMYQYLKATSKAFDQVIGVGSPGGTFRNSGYALPAVLPAGYNGPAINASDRVGITDGDIRSDERSHIVTGQLEWSFLNQSVSYVGSYVSSKGANQRPGDRGNLIIGYDYVIPTYTDSAYWTHELRIGSEERIAGMFDYVVGAFHSTEKGTSEADRGPSFGRGAFGDPRGAPNAFSPAVERYSSRTIIAGQRDNEETSFFGNITAHLGERTELSAGGRYIIVKKDSSSQNLRAPGGFSLVAAGGSGCGAGQTPSSYYAGFCDLPIAAGPLSAPTYLRGTHKPFIYNVQLSHRFSDELMAYANYGTSWRNGPTLTGITNGGIGSDGGAGDPTLRDLTFVEPEKSKSFELGLKATLFDGRGRFNIAAYRQDFDGLIYYGTATNYLSDNGFTAPSVARYNFTSNADARVDGVDVDLSYQFAPRWSMSGGFSYADGRIKDDFIPCNDGNFDGVADTIQPTVADFQTAGTRIAMCQSDRPVSQSPKWSLNVQSEYSLPLSDMTDGFIRGLLTYYPENPRDNDIVTIDDYGLLNIFTGIRDVDGGWEVSVFAKNITNTSQITSRDSLQTQSDGGIGNYFGASGYYAVRYTPRRQFGMNVRYSFGAR